MSIKYSLAEMKNPMRLSEAAKFYAKAQARSEVGLNRIADEISWGTTLTDGDVLNVLRGLIRKINEHLNDGDIVSLGEFGKFQYSISSTGAETPELFTTANIRRVRIRFRPGELVGESLQNLKFERVPSLKAVKQAAKDQYETPDQP